MAVFTVKGLKRVQKGFEKTAARIKNPRTGMELVAAKGFKDVMDHFKKEEGPNRAWPKWSRRNKSGSRTFFSTRPAPRDTKKKKKRSGALLQDTGKLRNSTRHRVLKTEAHIYNNVSYATYHHNGTSKMPKRRFLWISRKARVSIAKTFARFILKG